MADIGTYREFPLPGAVGMGIQPWMRPECNVVWEVCHYRMHWSHDDCKHIYIVLLKVNKTGLPGNLCICFLIQLFYQI